MTTLGYITTTYITILSSFSLHSLGIVSMPVPDVDRVSQLLDNYSPPWIATIFTHKETKTRLATDAIGRYQRTSQTAKLTKTRRDLRVMSYVRADNKPTIQKLPFHCFTPQNFCNIIKIENLPFSLSHAAQPNLVTD